MTGQRVEPAGVLVVDKPEGPTSHDVVAVVRRLLRTRQVGHTGTLDPMATGVLVLCLGRATRLARFLTGQDKTYRGTLRLGLETDTLDRTGRPVAIVRCAATSSIITSCLPPNPPPIRGLTTRIRLGANPSTGAICLRT